jgi:hypothetical protein
METLFYVLLGVVVAAAVFELKLIPRLYRGDK